MAEKKSKTAKRVTKQKVTRTRDYEGELRKARARAKHCENMVASIAAPMFVTGRDLAGCQVREDAI